MERDPRYEILPVAIRHLLTPKEFAWLPDDQKAALQEQFTEPEYEEDTC